MFLAVALRRSNVARSVIGDVWLTVARQSSGVDKRAGSCVAPLRGRNLRKEPSPGPSNTTTEETPCDPLRS